MTTERRGSLQNIMLGPFVSETAPHAPMTGLTIAAADVMISKKGAVAVAKNTGGLTHDVNGMYQGSFNGTDKDFAGKIVMTVKMPGAFVVKYQGMVRNGAIYDAIDGEGAAAFNASNQRVGVGTWNGVAVGPLNDVSQAQVLAQIEAALTATRAELPVAVPLAAASLVDSIKLMAMMARNGITVDVNGTPTLVVRNDAGVAVFSKQLSNTGGIYTEQQMVSG